MSGPWQIDRIPASDASPRRAPRITRIALTLALVVSPFAAEAATGVVISQVYGGGGNSGATLRNDFVELHNRSGVAVNLGGWSVQYASATGTTWQTTPLSGTIPAGGYYLVQQAQGTGGTANLPTPDAIGTIAMAGASGKVALVNVTTALSGASPTGAQIEDLVGYGTANGAEGSPAPTLTNTTAALRAASGCTDTENNAADFTAAAPAPRNATSAAVPCGASVVQPIVPSCPASTAVAGQASSLPVSASDADSVVNALAFASTPPSGFSLGTFTPAATTGGAASGSVLVGAGVGGGSYSVSLTWANNAGQTAACTLVVSVTGLTSIPMIQGSGAISPLVGQTVSTQGVVTKVTGNGFFLQDPVGDGDPATSDGIFVFTSTAPTVLAGQLVRLAATVAEFNVGVATNAQTAARPLTELTGISGLTVLSSGNPLPTPVTVTLPEAVEDDLERFEGMLVTLTGPLTVSQNFFLGRYGQLTLSASGRLETPTNRYRPGANADALADENARRRILLDDGTSLQNPNPTPYLAADNTVRAGDVVASVTGIIDFGLATSSTSGFGDYRIQPVSAVSISRANARTTTPDAVGGNVRVASANLLNYFTTFTDGSTAGGLTGQGCSLDGAVSAANCRGADSVAEFTRQRTKLIASLQAMGADVVGLMEVQNSGNVAVQNLVDGLNAAMGAGTYAALPVPAAGTGTDAIRVAMIYRPGRVTPVGAPASDTDPLNNRPPLAQTFQAPNGERFTVVVNHLKSKGSCPTSTSDPDADQGDGQGCWNARRVQQAQRLRSFVDGLVAANGVADVLLIGDFNSYAKEDPIEALTANGWVDQIGRFNAFGYSYVFDGAAGRLDHAISTDSLSPKVTGAIEWHVNADEPSMIDYNLEFKQPACATCEPDYYTPTPYRSSDHDPVVIGLNLVRTLNGTAGRDTIVGTPGDDVIVGGEGADLLTGGGGADRFVYTSLRDATDTITDFVPGVDRIDLRALLVSIGYGGAQAIADGRIRVVDSSAGASVQVDPDGPSGPSVFRPLVTLRGITAAQIQGSRDLGL